MPFEALFLGAGFVAGFASGLAGFAFNLVVLSLWLHLVSPTRAVVVALAASLLAQLISLWRLRLPFQPALLWPFVLGGALGIPMGTAAVTGLDIEIFKKGIGLFLVLYAAFMLLQPPLPAFVGGGRLADGAVGAVAGALGGAAGLSGALMPIWCDLRGWPRQDQRAVYQPFIVVMQSLALVSLGVAGAIDGEALRLVLIAAPVVVGGVLAGVALYARLSGPQFRRVLMALLLVSGVLLLV